jgi:phenylacetate-CoA ligase
LGTGLIKKVRSFEDLELLSDEELVKIQNQKLEKLLGHSLINSKDQAFQVLRGLPILEKDGLRRLTSAIENEHRVDLYSTQSSGTTGPSSKVFFTKEEINIPRAIQIYWLKRCGYNLGDRILQIGVDEKRSLFKKTKDFIFNTTYINGIAHSEKEILDILYSLKSRPKDVFMGYASSLFLFAKVALKYGIKDIRFKFLYSFGEMLLPHYRSIIERAFGSPIFDTYGSSEGLMIGLECKFGNYHTLPNHTFIEIVDNQKNEVEIGEVGDILVTGLDNKTTPLVRYRIGDLARKETNTVCKCGSKFPYLSGVIGRTSDVIMLPSGKEFTVQTVIKLLKDITEIDHFQLEKKSAQELILHVTINEYWNDTIYQLIKDRFMPYLKDQVDFVVQTHIEPLSQDSKLRLIIDNSNFN